MTLCITKSQRPQSIWHFGRMYNYIRRSFHIDYHFTMFSISNGHWLLFGQLWSHEGIQVLVILATVTMEQARISRFIVSNVYKLNYCLYIFINFVRCNINSKDSLKLKRVLHEKIHCIFKVASEYLFDIVLVLFCIQALLVKIKLL